MKILKANNFKMRIAINSKKTPHYTCKSSNNKKMKILCTQAQSQTHVFVYVNTGCSKGQQLRRGNSRS